MYTRASTSSSCGRSSRPPGSTATRSPPRRHSRPRRSRPARRSKRRGAAPSRSCGRPATTRCRIAPWASASSTTSRSPRARVGARTRRDRRLRRAPRERNAGDLLGRRQRALRLAPPVAVLSGERGAGGAARHDGERADVGRMRATRSTCMRSTMSSSRRSRASSRSSCSCPPASTRTRTTRSPG